MGSPRQQARASLADRLLRAALALTIVPLATNILLLLAGTFQVQDSTRPGAKRIGLSSLAVVSFNGIVPSDLTNTYLVNLQYFQNAFTYSYPSSPSAETASGILQSGSSPSLDPYVLIQRLPSILALPPSDTSCLSHAPSPDPETDASRCSPFWLAVQRIASWSGHFRFRASFLGMKLSFAYHLNAIIVILILYAQEAGIRYRPGWMRCRCRFAFQRRWCPQPKGTAEQVAKMPARTWNKTRLVYYGFVVMYCFSVVLEGTSMGYFFVMSLGGFEEILPEGETVDTSS